jgi:TPR repeat protein
MVEQDRNYRSYDSDFGRYDEDITDTTTPPYSFGRSARTDPRHSVPLFLSDNDGEPHPSEYIAPLSPLRNHRRISISSKLLAGALAMAAMAILAALFSSDATRDVIGYAKASIAALIPASSAAAQPDSTQLTPNDVALKDPTRLSSPANQTPGARTVTTVAVAMPSRADITTAYQSALQGRTPAAVAPPVAAAAPPPARTLDAEELATLMNRAKGLLAAGDIPPARLLLERAADAQEPVAALMLARTYDPDVLGTRDARNIIADPATARVWYQRAAQLGSADAQRRLAQLQN